MPIYFSLYYITLENNIVISIYNHVKNSGINILHWNIYFNIRLSNILTWVFTPIYFMYIFQCSHFLLTCQSLGFILIEYELNLVIYKK